MKKQTGFTLIELLTVFVGLLALGLVGVGIWVAAHFIAKFW